MGRNPPGAAGDATGAVGGFALAGADTGATDVGGSVCA